VSGPRLDWRAAAIGLGLGLGAVYLLDLGTSDADAPADATASTSSRGGPGDARSEPAPLQADGLAPGLFDPGSASPEAASQIRPRTEARRYQTPDQDTLRPLYDDPVALHSAVDPARWEDLADALAARGQSSLAERAMALADQVAEAAGSPQDEPLASLLSEQSLLLSQVSEQDGSTATRALVDPLLMAVHALQQGGDHPSQTDPKSGRPR
jgi:hypothetical protein